MRHVQVVVLRVRGFEPPPLLVSFCFRYGVVGNMSGFHPVASGSIPGIGSFVKLLQVRLEEFFSCFSALLAQLAERNPPKVEAVGSIPTSG